jgi:hypothetical protein
MSDVNHKHSNKISTMGETLPTPEVKLPHAELSVAARQVAVLVREGETQLNELEHVHVAPITPP